jgi:hypothetical protein
MTAQAQMLPAILAHTPWWVFAVIAALILTGVQALRPRVVAMWRLLIVPAIFIGWGLFSVVQRSAATPMLGADWIAAVVLGTMLGWTTTRLAGYVFEAHSWDVRVPGSPTQLVRNVVIFFARYGIAVAMAFATTPGDRSWLIACDVAVSGLAAGYFVGWIGRVGRAHRSGAGAPRAAAKLAG